MINQLLKIKIETNPANGLFNFADIVELKCFVKGTRLEHRIFKAKITGKVKNANAYVINVSDLNRFYPIEEYNKGRDCIISLKKKYGYPIRQIELAWGKFSGSLGEFIVPEHELTRVDK